MLVQPERNSSPVDISGVRGCRVATNSSLGRWLGRLCLSFDIKTDFRFNLCYNSGLFSCHCPSVSSRGPSCCCSFPCNLVSLLVLGYRRKFSSPFLSFFFHTMCLTLANWKTNPFSVLIYFQPSDNAFENAFSVPHF